jgi:hypothetical protein
MVSAERRVTAGCGWPWTTKLTVCCSWAHRVRMTPKMPRHTALPGIHNRSANGEPAGIGSPSPPLRTAVDRPATARLTAPVPSNHRSPEALSESAAASPQSAPGRFRPRATAPGRWLTLWMRSILSVPSTLTFAPRSIPRDGGDAVEPGQLERVADPVDACDRRVALSPTRPPAADRNRGQPLLSDTLADTPVATVVGGRVDADAVVDVEGEVGVAWSRRSLRPLTGKPAAAAARRAGAERLATPH